MNIIRGSLTELKTDTYSGDKYKDKVAVFEDCSLMRREDGLYSKSMLNAKCRFLLIERDWYPSVPIDYRAFYEWNQDNFLYSLIPHYQNYDKLDCSQSKYVVEDGKSGLQYFKSKFNDVETPHGNANLFKFEDRYIIADAAGIGRFMNVIVQNNKEGMYLPTSFECVVSKGLFPDSPEVLEPLEYCSDRTFNSFEWYYTDLLSKLLKESTGSWYRKGQCPDYIINSKSVGKAFGIGIASVWDRYVEKYDIQNPTEEAKRLKKLTGAKSKEELFEYIEKYLL